MSKTDLSASLRKLLSATFFNHKGLIVERVPNGFMWNRQTFETLEMLDTHIQSLCKNIKFA